MGLVAGALWADARQGRRECSYSLNTGATEDDASRRRGRLRRRSAYFAKPSKQGIFNDEGRARRPSKRSCEGGGLFANRP